MGLLQALNLPPRPGQGPNTEKLSQAAQAWLKTQRQAGERIAALKQSVKAHCADEHPALLQEIEKGLAKLDKVLNTVDHRLADSLANAGKTADERAQKAELKNAKSILAEYINYVKSEPLVAHMDQNPFDVKTDLKTLLIGGLADAARAIG
jgi:ABC-type transporter Mla subunit MlaD